MRDMRALFPTDDPVPANMMIGRRRDVEEIAEALIAGTNIVLAGPRRTGKTSVGEAALARVRRAGLYTATVDLFRRRDASDLAEGIAEAVMDPKSLSHAARSATRAGRSASRPPSTGSSSMRPWTRCSSSTPRALAAALELPERIAVADGKRVAVLARILVGRAPQRGAAEALGPIPDHLGCAAESHLFDVGGAAQGFVDHPPVTPNVCGSSSWAARASPSLRRSCTFRGCQRGGDRRGCRSTS